MSTLMSKQPLGCILSWELVRPYPVYQMMSPFSLLLGDYNPHCIVFLSGIAFTQISCKPLKKTHCPVLLTVNALLGIMYRSMRFETYQYIPICLIVLQSHTC